MGGKHHTRAKLSRQQRRLNKKAEDTRTMKQKEYKEAKELEAKAKQEVEGIETPIDINNPNNPYLNAEFERCKVLEYRENEIDPDDYVILNTETNQKEVVDLWQLTNNYGKRIK